MNVKAPRGTNDILPPLSLQWQYVEDVTRKLLQKFNYQEIRTPIFEYTELFQRGIGEGTDIVEKEMYTFADKGGRSITLRPEGTASVVRSFLENKVYGQAQPTKYYYIGPMFRYERPQAGRFRQFHQLGVEAFGSNDPALDAEVIVLGVNLLEELGLTNFDVYINSIGCPKCRKEYLTVLKEYLNGNKNKLCTDCQARMDRNTLRVLDCKNERCSEIVKGAPKIIDYLCADCQNHFSQVKEYLDLLAVDYQVSPTLVRGLDYYTNTAFEVKYHGLGAQDALFGGGRYNGLVEEIGNKSIPGIGFAIGLERLILTIKEQGIQLLPKKGIDLYIVTIGEKAKKTGFLYLQKLRKSGLKTEIDYLDRGVKGQLKAANRLNAKYTIILGDDEIRKRTAVVKNMESGEQVTVELNNLVKRIQELL